MNIPVNFREQGRQFNKLGAEATFIGLFIY